MLIGCCISSNTVLLILGLSGGNEAAKASVVLDQLDGVDGEAAWL